ncbi:MAG: DNA-directed RNA polymerase subunit alpha C-terminal domain-containing protein [Patescibacteria group bacterium]|jgi:hypothetical protein
MNVIHDGETGGIRVFFGETVIDIDPRDPRCHGLLNDRGFMKIANIKCGSILIVFGRSLRTKTARMMGEIMFGWTLTNSSNSQIVAERGVRVRIGGWKPMPVPHNCDMFELLEHADALYFDTMEIRTKASEVAARALGPFIMIPFVPPEPTPSELAIAEFRRRTGVEPTSVLLEAEAEDAPEPPVAVPAGAEANSPIPGLTPEQVKNLIRRCDELGFTTRVTNGLRTVGCEFVYQVVEKTGPETLGAKGLGRRSNNELRVILAELGLSFGMNFTTEQRAALERLAHQLPR